MVHKSAVRQHQSPRLVLNRLYEATIRAAVLQLTVRPRHAPKLLALQPTGRRIVTDWILIDLERIQTSVPVTVLFVDRLDQSHLRKLPLRSSRGRSGNTPIMRDPWAMMMTLTGRNWIDGCGKTKIPKRKPPRRSSRTNRMMTRTLRKTTLL
jgi:hypothetical protein